MVRANSAGRARPGRRPHPAARAAAFHHATPVPLAFQAVSPSPIQGRSDWAALRWQQTTTVTAPEANMNHIHGTHRLSVTLAGLAAAALALPACQSTATAAVHRPH